MAIPSLDHLSAGQSTLFAMFATLLRYGDVGIQATSFNAVEGIAIVDEIDAHLHADLQHDALPALIKLFPRVQFIVSSNAPLFPLGMQRLFGSDGFTLIEMPTGTTIDAERYSEFEASLAYFRATKTFENDVKQKVSEGQKPLILCEGETDPHYLRKAAEVLGMTDLLAAVDFDWVGVKTSAGASGSGKSSLDEACRFLKHNPNFLKRKTLALYDSDARKPAEDAGDLFVRCLPHNDENTFIDSGIENLLPETVFVAPFVKQVEFRSKGMPGTRTELDKTALCKHLTEGATDPTIFEKFRPALIELRQLLLPEPLATDTGALSTSPDTQELHQSTGTA